MKRIVSLVPSWTETLIEAGANVVGRTRFCIHPADRVRSIPAVGGTKSFDASQLRALAPDLIIMDREENTREMFELAQTIAPVHVSHVESVSQMPGELRALATAMTNSAEREQRAARHADAQSGDTDVRLQLEAMALRFETVLTKPALVLHNGSAPGVLKIQKGELRAEDDFVYIIWKDPWMCVSRDTFIGSMLTQVGFSPDRMWKGENPTSKYPKLDAIPQRLTVLLSSEPYPFAKKPTELANENIALLDGESYSWFGLRALRFLESAKA